MARVFISHSSRDKEPAERIMAWLSEQGFETPFLDFDKHGGIQPGADWEKTLYREIERAEAIVIIQTPNWLDSKWCFAEFTQARALGKAIFPIIETPTGDTLISPDIQALDLLKDREGGLEQLSSQLTQIALDAQGGFDWDASRPPYPGLLAFQEEDAALYFGRDDDIRRLIERLDARRAQGGKKLIALLGASGSGKSSLLRAGVIPRLKRAGRNWVVLPAMRPQVRPVDELARSLAVGCGGERDWRKLREELNGDNLAHSLSDIANDLRMRASANEAQILLPIDQGEELFGAADPDQARRFCEILNVALSSDLPFIAVIAMRSDYLGLLQSAEHLTARFEEFSIAPMPLARIAQIIEGPARVAGLGIDEAFVHRAVQDAKTEDALPLLAFALRELYDHAADDNYLSLAEYNALGDAKEELSPLENAVRKAADNVLAEAKPSDEELTALREAFVPAMVRVNEQGEYVRQPARWDELPSKAHSLLERLAKARLLIVSQDGDNRMVEVAHEALLRKWPRLRGWLDDAREFLSGKQQLERDLHDWDRATDEDKTGALLTGLKLNRARGWLIERPQQLTAEERALVQASIKHADAAEQEKEERRKREIKRARMTVFSAAVGGLIFIGAAFFFRDAQLSEISALTRTSEARLASDPLNALLNGLRATKKLNQVVMPNARVRAQVRAALQKVVYGVKERDRLEHGNENIISGLGPDGRKLANLEQYGFICYWDHLVCIWDKPGDLKGTQFLEPKHSFRFKAFSPDYSRLIVVSEAPTADGTLDGSIPISLRVWDLKSKEPIRQFEGRRPDVTSLSFSPNGKHSAIAGNEGISLWDANGKQIDELHEPQSRIKQLVFSPDGTKLAAVNSTVSFKFESGDRIELTGEAKIILWDLKTKQVIEIKEGAPYVDEVIFSPDGLHVATRGHHLSTENNIVRFWDFSGTQVGHLNGVSSRPIFSRDGRWLAFAGEHGVPRVWDLLTNKQLFELKGHQGKAAPIIFSPNGSQLVTMGDNDSTIRLWDLGGKEVLELKSQHELSFYGFSFSPDSETFATTESDGTARLWDLMGNPLKGFRGTEQDLSWRSSSVVFSPNGARLAVTGEDAIIRLWNVKTGELLDEKSEMTQLHDGSFLLTNKDKDGVVYLWNWDGEELAKFKDLKGELQSVSLSSNGNRIATVETDTSSRVDIVRLWDWDGEEKAQFQASASDLIFSSDGSLLATSGWGLPQIWDLSGKEVAKFEAPAVVTISLSPDATIIATADIQGVIKLWDLETELHVAEFNANDSVKQLAFSPDGKILAAVANDGKSIKFWQVESHYDLVVRGCNWVRNYLANITKVEESDKHICDDIGAQK